MTQLSMRIAPSAAYARSDLVGNGSSKRRYVFTMSSWRPTVRSRPRTAEIRPCCDSAGGRTQAPTIAPAGGGVTGPASNGPPAVAIPGRAGAGGVAGAPGNARRLAAGRRASTTSAAPPATSAAASAAASQRGHRRGWRASS
jgi:hypothetical protein